LGRSIARDQRWPTRWNSPVDGKLTPDRRELIGDRALVAHALACDTGQAQNLAQELEQHFAAHFAVGGEPADRETGLVRPATGDRAHNLGAQMGLTPAGLKLTSMTSPTAGLSLAAKNAPVGLRSVVTKRCARPPKLMRVATRSL
jgi:hypothetical protein